MERTLYRRLALVLLGLFFLIGALFLTAMIFTARLHLQEVSQRFNRTLAGHLASGNVLLKDGGLDEEAVAEIFHMLMVVNPGIEIYLLDGTGKILSYSAPPEKIRLEKVDTEPIKALLARSRKLPIHGDDPRNPGRKKVFSAAPLAGDDGGKSGYLYVILGGEDYESAAQPLRGSYILQLSVIVVSASLVFALAAALLFFRHLTRRLHRIAAMMERFRESGFTERPVDASATKGGDEIDRIGNGFAVMAERIGRQIEELRRADTERRELVTNVSHDLRTPLASLRGYLETLLMKEAELAPGQRREYLATAFENTDKLDRRISDLLELALLDSPGTSLGLENFPLGELADAVAQKFRIAAQKKNIAIVVHCPAEDPLVRADIGLVERALENLLGNALRASGDGGSIDISLRPLGGSVEVAVADRGRGISAEEQEKIFERRYRSAERGGRAGLGLAITRRIVELHGGGITVVSAQGQGATFRFSLPSPPGPRPAG